MTAYDQFTLEVCLSVEDAFPGCVSSSTQGRLRGGFVDSRSFGLWGLDDLSLEDGTIRLRRPYCSAVSPTSSLSSCQDQSIRGIAYEEETSFNLAFVVDNTITWNGTRQTPLGCFYVKRMDGLNFSAPADGWSMGFTYSDTEAGRNAVSATKLCRSIAPSPGTNETRPPKSMVLSTTFVDYDFPVCTLVDVRRIDNRKFEVCLGRAASSLDSCGANIVNASLAGIYFDSAAFNVTQPRDLILENGTIQFATPLCTSLDGREGRGRVEACGQQGTTGLGLGDATNVRLDVGLAVVKTNPWQAGTDEFSLGCFYVTGPEVFDPTTLLKGWSIGLRYNDVEVQGASSPVSSVMLGKLGEGPPLCKHSVIATQLPSSENRLLGVTAQVCTELEAQAVPNVYTTTFYPQPPQVRICLATTRDRVQCGNSAQSGRLRAVFLDTREFGVEDPASVTAINSTIKVMRDSCVGGPGSNVSDCRGWNVAGGPGAKPLPYGYNLAFEVARTSFDAADGEAELGCFLVQAINITVPPEAWKVGLVYSDVNGNSSTKAVMVGRVCADDPPAISVPNTDLNVISHRVPSTAAAGSTDGLVCVAVYPPVAVDPSTTAICLATTTEYPGCVTSATSGRLDWVFMDSTRLGLSDPDAFSFESGPANNTLNPELLLFKDIPGNSTGLRIRRPYCARDPVTGRNASLDCLGVGGAFDPPLVKGSLLTVGLPIRNVTWQSANQELGCLYVTSPDLYTSAHTLSSTRFTDWAMAFRFSELDGIGVSRRRRQLASGSGFAYIAGATFPDPTPSDAPSTDSSCARSSVTLRVPQGDDQGNTTQVCTSVNVTATRDPSILQVCLSAHDALPGCVSSSTQGRLRSVFMDAQAFGGPEASQVISVEDGTIWLNRPYLQAPSPVSPLLECQGQNVTGIAYEDETYFNRAFTVRNYVAWNGSREAALGCFYVKRMDGLNFSVPADGWSMGFTYSDTDQDRKAISATKLCESFTPSPGTNATCPEESMMLDTTLEDDTPSVCTLVDVQRVDNRKFEVCLGRAASSLDSCGANIVNASLAGIYFDSAAFNVTQPRDLTLENGTIQFATPLCTSLDGREGRGRVEACGQQGTTGLGLGDATNVRLDVGLAVVKTNPWQAGTDEFSLGCFYVTGPDTYDKATLLKGWSIGLRYNDVEVQGASSPVSSVMLGKLCQSITLCNNSVIATQLPSSENRLLGVTAQVCTQVVAQPLLTVLRTGQSRVRICLATTRDRVQCGNSAQSGRLRAVFLDTREFGVEDPASVTAINSTIKVMRDSCVGGPGSNVSDCRGWNVAGGPGAKPLPYGYNLAFEVARTSFDAADGEAELGCFLVQAINITVPPEAWKVGLVYSDVNGNSSTKAVMVGRVCADDPPAISVPNTDLNVISHRVPSTAAAGSTDGLVCVAVYPPVAVDPSTTAICLATTTEYPGCVTSATSGRLDWVFMDSTRLGLSDPDAFSFESGPANNTLNPELLLFKDIPGNSTGLRIRRPYCARDPVTGRNASLDCLGVGGAFDPPLVKGSLLTVGLPIRNVTWQSANQELGCLYVTSPDLYTSAHTLSSTRFTDWAMAFRFSEVTGSGSSGFSYMAGWRGIPDPTPSDAPSTDSSCARSSVTLRVPQGDDQGNTTQVCTSVNVTATRDPSILQVCLSAHDALPGCVSSSTQGRLRSVFMDAQAFGGPEASQVISVEDGTIWLNRPYLQAPSVASPLLDGQDQSVRGIAYEGETFFNRAFTVRNYVAWNGSREAALGCFYVKRMDGLNFSVPAADGWSMGFTYNDTDLDRDAISATKLCRPYVPSPSTNETRPSGSMVAVTPVSSNDPSVCTLVDVQRVDNRKFEVCLGRAASSLDSCGANIVNASLAGIYFDSAAFNVTQPRDLTLENGTIQFATPLCTSLDGREGRGRVEACGQQGTTGLGLGDATNVRLDVGLAVVKTNPWQAGTDEFSLGCFYVTGPEVFDPTTLLKGWSIGLRYNDVEVQGASSPVSSVMLGKLGEGPPLCKHSVIATQLPSSENRLLGVTAQVCTELEAQAVPNVYTTTFYPQPPQVRICLATTRDRVQCGNSAQSGRLRAVFLDTREFGVEDPASVTAINSTIKVMRDSCVGGPGSNVSDCRGWNVAGGPGAKPLPYGYNLAFEVARTSFDAADGEAELGCFLVQAINITVPPEAWKVGLVYSDVNGNSSTKAVMVGRVCADDPPAISVPNTDLNVISHRVPSTAAAGSTDGLVCVAVYPPVAVDPSTTAICLATTTEYPGCVTSATSGRLDWVFMDSTRLGLSDPDAFSFESGPANNTLNPELLLFKDIPGNSTGLRIRRPYCARDPVTGRNASLDCLGVGGAFDPPLVKGSLLTVGLPIRNVTWQSANQELGCLYVTSPDLYTSAHTLSSTRFTDWAMAFRFSELDGIGVSRRRRQLASGSGFAYIAGATFPDPTPSDAPSTDSSCARSSVTLRVPQGDDQGNTTQVCTSVNVTATRDPSILQVCLSAHDYLPGCVSSSTQGQLRSVFMDAEAFGGAGGLPTDQRRR